MLSAQDYMLYLAAVTQGYVLAVSVLVFESKREKGSIGTILLLCIIGIILALISPNSVQHLILYSFSFLSVELPELIVNILVFFYYFGLCIIYGVLLPNTIISRLAQHQMNLKLLFNLRLAQI
jgi:hypothetical protein